MDDTENSENGVAAILMVPVISHWVQKQGREDNDCEPAYFCRWHLHRKSACLFSNPLCMVAFQAQEGRNIFPVGWNPETSNKSEMAADARKMPDSRCNGHLYIKMAERKRFL